MATSRICLSSTGYSATELIPFYKRLSFTNSIKLTINELQSKRLRTKNNTQTHMYRHTVEEHHLYCTGFGHLQGLMDTDPASVSLSPLRLTACHPLPSASVPLLPKTHKTQAHFSREGHAQLSWTNIHKRGCFLLSSQKEHAKTPHPTMAGVHGKLIFYHVHGRKFMASKPSIKEQYTVTKDNLTEFQSISLAELTLFYTSR